CERELGLVRNGGGHVARAKAVKDKGRKTVIDQRLGMRDMGGCNAEAARHHHHQRPFSIGLAAIRGRQEQFSVDRQLEELAVLADHLKVVERIRRGNFETLSLRAVDENDVLIAKSQGYHPPQPLLLWLSLKNTVERRFFPSKQICPAVLPARAVKARDSGSQRHCGHRS